MAQFKVFFVLGPIASLLLFGLWLTLRSGVAKVRSGQGWRQLATNIYQTILLLALCLAALTVIQRFVGHGTRLGW
jgi:hypothetical protein